MDAAKPISAGNARAGDGDAGAVFGVAQGEFLQRLRVTTMGPLEARYAPLRLDERFDDSLEGVLLHGGANCGSDHPGLLQRRFDRIVAGSIFAVLAVGALSLATNNANSRLEAATASSKSFRVGRGMGLGMTRGAEGKALAAEKRSTKIRASIAF